MRRDFLVGMGGLAVGLPLGAAGARHVAQAAEEFPPGAHVSYAQAGEDLVVNFIFESLKARTISYLDIGAYDPVYLSNTYYFYRRGHRGVLVEPNVAMCEKLRAV